MNRQPMELPKTRDASKRICVRNKTGDRVWKLMVEIEPTDTVVEIGKGFGLIGDGSRLPLQVFRK